MLYSLLCCSTSTAVEQSVQRKLYRFYQISDFHQDPNYDAHTTDPWCRPVHRKLESTELVQTGRSLRSVGKSHSFARTGPVSDEDMAGAPNDMHEGSDLDLITHIDSMRSLYKRFAKQPAVHTAGGRLLLNQESVSQTEPDSEEGRSLPAYLGRFGCDSPPALVESAIASMREYAYSCRGRREDRGYESGAEGPAFIVVTGDFVAHEYGHDPELRVSIIKNTTAQLEAAFPNVPLLLLTGNNDLLDNYWLPESAEWTKRLLDAWRQHVPADQTEAFLRGGYYAKRPLAGAPLLFLMLNSNLWSASKYIDAYWNGTRPDDPAGQFAWMEEQLAKAAANGDQVMIAGHIPPGYNMLVNWLPEEEREWHDDFSYKYRGLLLKYRSVIKLQLFGHFHMDDFRVQYANDKEKQQALQMQSADSKLRGNNPSDSEKVALSAALLAPAVSPLYGNNPSWRSYEFVHTHTAKVDAAVPAAKPEGAGALLQSGDAVTGIRLQDYVQFYLPLYSFDSLGTYAPPSTPPLWREEYRWTAAYGEEELSVESLARVMERFKSDYALFSKFLHLKRVSVEVPVFYQYCTLASETPADLAECIRAAIEKHLERMRLVEAANPSLHCDMYFAKSETGDNVSTARFGDGGTQEAVNYPPRRGSRSTLVASENKHRAGLAGRPSLRASLA